MRTRKQPPKSEHKLVPRLGNQVAALHKCDKVASCRLYHSHPRQPLYGGLGMSVYACGEEPELMTETGSLEQRKQWQGSSIQI